MTVGDGTQEARKTRVPVTGLTNITAIAAGNWHSMAMKKDGSVWSWGNNGAGQLGDNSITTRNVPVKVGF